jgi:uncharacterized membrane protein YeaQ/YmgE (transglycosylase-associated protein family)
MSIENIFTWLLVGLVSGWLAGLVMKGRGYGIAADILLGIVGAFIGGFLFGLMNVFASGVLGNIVVAFVGAVVVVTLVRTLRGHEPAKSL